MKEESENEGTYRNFGIESREREERLRQISKKLRTPSGLTHLENEPAYKRSNITLEEGPKSDSDETSKFTLEHDGEEVILKKSNSFLHDNVD